MKRVGQVEQRPGQNDDVVAVQDETDRDGTVAHAFGTQMESKEEKRKDQKLESVLIKFFGSFFRFSFSDLIQKFAFVYDLVHCDVGNH